MDDYKRGLEQFRQMVGDENIDGLIERFRSVCPDFEKEVVAVEDAFGLEKVLI